VIYVRQSSLQQVEQNRESQRRQYQLVERAQALGWPTARCLVIDDDLGISAAHSANRPGYQRLVSMVALREVGLVLGLEVSRLAHARLLPWGCPVLHCRAPPLWRTASRNRASAQRVDALRARRCSSV
jgi:DNA invertase Pin-like site-specific DNA recombinase